MKHRLGLLLALPLLAACGAAHGAASTTGGSHDIGYRVLDLISSPNGGGVPSTSLTWLSDDDASSEFAAQFNPDLEAKLHEALAAPDVAPGGALFAAVVAVGCDVPTAVTAQNGLEGPMVSAAPVPTPKAGCAVPITTVAIISGPVP
jgi:hypothetical protein